MKALGASSFTTLHLQILYYFSLVIYFLVSLSRALKQSNQDLRKQLEKERTEEKRKVYAMAGG